MCFRNRSASEAEPEPGAPGTKSLSTRSSTELTPPSASTAKFQPELFWAGPSWRYSLYSRSNTRSEEHTSELQSLMRISYAVFCLKKKKNNKKNHTII